MEGHVEWSAPHVTDMQAATNHVQSGDVTEAAMAKEEEEDPEAEIKNPDGKTRFGLIIMRMKKLVR